MSKYDINSIQSLSFKDAVRTRIQMYLGSDNMEGIYNGIQEIVTNSIDEFRVGYGDLISISLDTLSDDSQSITIEDFGRGVPFGIKEDGSNTLVDIFSKSHTGGKFDSKSYQSSAGLNGIGAKAVALSSYYFKIESHRDGKAAVAKFKKGDLISYEEIESSRKNGTVISYVPDPEVYKQEKIRIDFKELCSRYKRLSYLTKGMTFVLTDVKNKEVKTYSAAEGIKELVKEVSEDPVHASVIYGEAEEDGDSVEVAMCWNRNLKETSFVFTNGLENREGGTSLTGTKMALTRSLKKEIEGNVTGEILRTGLVYVVNSTVKHPSFAGQTKDKVNNSNLNGLAQRAVREALNSLIKDNSFEFTQIIDFLGKERKAEEAAENARREVREATKQIQSKTKAKSFSTDKLYDARYLGQDSILYLCEGGSAVGTLGNSRNPDRVGLLELRGKIINPLTNTEEKVLSNDEVQLIFAALGQTPGKYNPDKLRYGKVGIASDGDSDRL